MMKKNEKKCANATRAAWAGLMVGDALGVGVGGEQGAGLILRPPHSLWPLYLVIKVSDSKWPAGHQEAEES